MPPVTGDAPGQDLARVVRKIPGESWTPEQRRRAAARAPEDAAYLREAFQRIGSQADAATASEIHERASQGDLLALAAIDDLSAIPAESALGLAEALEDSIHKKIADAESGSFGHGGPDLPHTLAIINHWHSTVARWNVLADFLRNPAVLADQQQDLLGFLARSGARLTNKVREQFLDVVG
ncbi:hypothetical protein IEU95_16000 [Hoyosella rhizosphaerae]|uniref:Uncharacterized protein n=1 Tax=Hoyosella rhizosphaerae TaxID=1755582 RepID=A0A916UKE9_9ACTN|nr:hypothetical protein [Hoyosella rhizosphaerae]MBN4928338.1 hypothetical protein [Hoyosella rhizosphaerae]GGC74178.1 hypothetical protein GCM10011410_29280 [Hoyosella rhizosphaerae]